jgi:hypothetical protein
LSLFHHGAQRASRRQRTIPGILVLGLAAAFAIGGVASQPGVTHAAGKKVVIVVGPAGSATSKYRSTADSLASQARSYGASVYKLYSPYATWSRVRNYAQGANVLIYLGHGNGWPSPYGPFQPYTKDGMGLNSSYGNGNSNVKYWGEYYISRYINLAPNAVVILNHLCYASGNNEWGAGYPTRTTAKRRVDNYGAGFLRANARAVFADGTAGVSYVLYGLFKTNRTMLSIFYSSPSSTYSYRFSFRSDRTSWATAAMDPSSPGHYYHSLIGSVYMTASTWRS